MNAQLAELHVPPLQLDRAGARRSPGPSASLAFLRRAAAAAWAHRVSATVALAVFGLVAFVHAHGMSFAPGWVDDEGTYVSQAWAVQHGRGLAHYTYWYDHPPLGWLQLASWTWLTGAFRRAVPAVVAGRQAMLVAQLVSCALLFGLARRLGLRRAAAGAAVAVFAFSPLAVSFQRMVFLDNIATPWLLAAFFLALSPDRRIGAAIGSGLCFAVAVLTKETTLLLFPALAWQAGRHADPHTRRAVLGMLSVTSALVIAAYPLLALLKGELLPGRGHVSLLSSAAWQLSGRDGSGSLLDAASPVRGLIGSWLASDPWLVIGGLAAVPFGLASRRLRPVALAVAIPLLTLARGGYVPHPFLINVFPFAALLIAGAGDALWGRRPGPVVPFGRQPRRLLVVASVAAIALLAGPQWARGLDRLVTPVAEVPIQQAGRWLEAHATPADTLVVEDTIWVDLVRAGFVERRVIWFYKIDLDPGVRLPGGWRDIDYLALGPLDPFSLRGMPVLQAAVEHGVPVASFGEGPSAVTVYRIDG